MNQLLSSTIELQADIQKCLDMLVNARLNHDKTKEAEALWKMENLMVGTVQQLQCIIDKLEEEQS